MCVLLAFLAVASFNVIMCLSVFIIYICEPFNGRNNGNIFICSIRFFGATINIQQTMFMIVNVMIDMPINGQK